MEMWPFFWVGFRSHPIYVCLFVFLNSCTLLTLVFFFFFNVSSRLRKLLMNSTWENITYTENSNLGLYFLGIMGWVWKTILVEIINLSILLYANSIDCVWIRVRLHEFRKQSWTIDQYHLTSPEDFLNSWLAGEFWLSLQMSGNGSS